MAGSKKTQVQSQAPATKSESVTRKAKSSKKQVVQEEPEQQVTQSSKGKKSSKKTSEKQVEVQQTQEVVQQETTQQETEQSEFSTTLQSLQADLKSIKDMYTRVVSELRKLETQHNKEIKKVRKHKQKRNGNHKATGFAKPRLVPDKLAKFIGVPSGTELTGPQITSAVWKQLHARNLTYVDDKRVFRTNKEVSALFGVASSVNSSTDHRDENGFNFCNLQKFVAYALKQ